MSKSFEASPLLSNGHQQKSKELPGNQPSTFIQQAFTHLNEIQMTQNVQLSENEQKRAIALAAMIKDPTLLPSLASFWDTTVPTIHHYIEQAYGSPEQTQLGQTLYDLSLTKEQQKKYEKTNQQKFKHWWEEQELKKTFPEYQSDGTLAIDEFTEGDLQEAIIGVLIEQPQSRNRDIAIDALSWMNMKTIAEKYGLGRNTVAQIISDFRKGFLEPRILIPLGLTRITKADTASLAFAAYTGTLPSFEVINIRYATRKQLAEYEERKRIVDPDMLASGYVLLAEAASDEEFSAILKNPAFKHFIVKKFNRLYIQPEVLERYKAIKKTRPKPHPLSGILLEVNSVAETRQESQKLRHAVERNKLHGVRHNNRLHVDTEQAQKILERTIFPEDV